MKHKFLNPTILALALAFSFVSAQSQNPKPEKIYSFVKVVKTPEWYDQQIKLWKMEIDKNKKNADAWLNYYRASRNRLICEATDTAIINHKGVRLKYIETEMGNNIPGTFEYHYIRWSNKENSEAYAEDWNQAKKLGDGRIELMPGLVNEAEFEFDIEKRDEACKKWYQTGDCSAGILNYNYNVLMSLPANSILITGGDNDTYPAWILQGALGIRKDVTVLNASLLFVDKYRQGMFKKLGIQQISLPDEHDTTPGKTFAYFQENILKNIKANKGGKPLCIAHTVGEDFYKPIEDKLYSTGLVMEYHDERIDNIALIKRNVEKVYKLDYLETSFSADVSQAIVNRMNCSYLTPLGKLYTFYKTAGEQQKCEETMAKIKWIASSNPQEKEVQEFVKSLGIEK
jgi:hypothetical protein